MPQRWLEHSLKLPVLFSPLVRQEILLPLPQLVLLALVPSVKPHLHYLNLLARAHQPSQLPLLPQLSLLLFLPLSLLPLLCFLPLLLLVCFLQLLIPFQPLLLLYLLHPLLLHHQVPPRLPRIKGLWSRPILSFEGKTNAVFHRLRRVYFAFLSLPHRARLVFADILAKSLALYNTRSAVYRNSGLKS